MVVRLFIFLILVLSLAACGSVPRPFSPGAKSGSTTLPAPGPASALIVYQVAGDDPVPLEALTFAVIDGLRRQDVAAIPYQVANRYRLFGGVIRGTVGNGHVDLIFTWQVARPDGTIEREESYRQWIPQDAWEGADPALMARLGDEATARVAALLGLNVAAEAGGPSVRLVVAGVFGAPGDGAEALTQSVLSELDRAGVPVSAEPQPLLPALEAHVDVRPAGNGRDLVRIIWLLRDRTGKERGRLEQQNTVPANSLNNRWGLVAGLAASAAAPGITELLARLDNSE